MDNDQAINHLHPTEPRWFAVYTKFQREKYVQKQLALKDIHAYVPLRKVTRQYRRKRRLAHLPLISGYVFVHIRRQEYVPVLETTGVVKFVRFARNLVAIPDQEMETLRRVVGEAPEVEAVPARLRVGDKVEIARGSLAGLQGRLLARQSNNFIVELNNIGYALELQVDPKNLLPVGQPKIKTAKNP